ncbi:hypothetical protein Tco_0746418 [Tanacetum coccineum]
MTTLAEFMIVFNAENHPPMLDKAMYNSWESRMLLYIKGKKNGRMMLESIENGPLVYITVKVDVQIQKKKYTKLTEQEQLQDDCDVQATKIVLQRLLPDVYAIVNHCQSAKDILERVKLLMKGTELAYQECECKLYNVFDKFTSVKGETLHEYYLRFDQLINDMHIIGMTMQQSSVEYKLYAYLSQHEGHANEVRMMCERYPHPLALVAHYQTQSNSAHQPTPLVPQNAYHSHPISQQPPVKFLQMESKLVVPIFLPVDDLIACLNKAMAFMVTIQQVQRIQGQSSSLGTIGNATTSRGNNATGQAREKLMLAEAHKSSQVLDKEQLAFLADPRITDCHDVQPIIIHKAAFQTDDLDAYDSDCDDISFAKAVLMVNLSSYGSNVLSKDKVNQETNTVNLSLTAEFGRWKERVLLADNKCLVNDNLEIERLEQEYDHLFEILLSQDIVHICVNSLASRNDFREMQQGFIDEYNKNLMLKAELAKKGQMVEKKFFDEVVLRCSRLENHNVNLELKLQHQKESFLNNKPLNNQNAPEILEFFKINEWQARLDAKDVSITNLRKHIKKLKGKNVVEKDARLNNPNVIAPGMFKLDLTPLAPKLLNNRDAHIDYIKHSREHADMLHEIVEHARALRPLDSDLDSACMIFQRIQEVLVYVKDTCPRLTKLSEKLVAITPLNKNKKVRFAEATTSSRMKSSTSTSRSHPSGNTKHNRILQTTSRNMKNKVEDHLRSVKSKSNKMNRVSESICNAEVKHTSLNANSEFIYVKCNQCMFDANHDVCFLEFVNDVNVHSKSKSAKRSKKKQT